MADARSTPIHPLRQRMIEDMTLRGINTASQRSYVRAVRACRAHMRRKPEALTLEEVARIIAAAPGLKYRTALVVRNIPHVTLDSQHRLPAVWAGPSVELSVQQFLRRPQICP
jgi:hypothetical protein